MPSLYDLTQEAAYLQQLALDGEIDQQVIDDTLESLGIDSKIEAICCVIRNMETRANACKEEEERIYKRRKVAENTVSRLKDSLLLYLEIVDKDRVDAGTFTVSKRKSKSVRITNEEGLPDEFLIYKAPTPDKTAIKQALTSGRVVFGAELVENTSVSIK